MTLIAQVEDFINTYFPGSLLKAGFEVIVIDAKATFCVTNRDVHQKVVDMLCESPSWLVSVRIDPDLRCNQTAVEKRIVTDDRYWDSTDEYLQYFMALQGSIDLKSIKKTGSPSSIILIEPKRQIIINLLTLRIYATEFARIEALLKGIHPLLRLYDELKAYLSQAFPNARHLAGAALVELWSDAAFRVEPAVVQAVLDKFRGRDCWLIACAVPQGLIVSRTDVVEFSTDASHRQVVAEVTGHIDAQALLRTHQPPQTLALVDPQSGIAFSLPDRTLYGTSHAALAAFTVGLEAELEPS